MSGETPPNRSEATPDEAAAAAERDYVDPPSWFERALADRPRIRWLTVRGIEIEFRRWGGNAGRPLLLIHGNAASASWWDAIAPLLASDHPVGAVSLAGMGNSGWRERYDMDGFAADATAALDALIADARDESPVVAGHSFGGHVAAELARRYAGSLGGLVVLDAGPLAPDRIAALRRPLSSTPRMRRIHSDRAALVRRYQLSPPQACAAPFVLRHVAEQAVVAAEGGWAWQTDPNLPQALGSEDAMERFRSLVCPVLQVYGDRSIIMQPEDVARFLSVAPAGTQAVRMADAGHHLLLDQPIAVAAVLGTFAASLQASAAMAPKPPHRAETKT